MIALFQQFWRRLVARNRIRHGYCPACNSDAPKLDKCPVCYGYRQPFPPTANTKREWWELWQAFYESED